MANDLPDAEEIKRKFIIRSPYGTNKPDQYPYGLGSCVILCEILCINADDVPLDPIYKVFRNEQHPNHAETLLLEWLRTDQSSEVIRTAKKVCIKTYQNYSPCNTVGVQCADEIITYMNEMENNEHNEEITMTITFANFYRTVVYENNDQVTADTHREGLRNLQSHLGVTLALLGEAEWEHLLQNENLVNLSYSAEERKACLDRAQEESRLLREIFDRTHLQEIRMNDFDDLAADLGGLELNT
jgi:hypothetical protein